MDEMMLVERLKTADALVHACLCVSSLQKVLPTCKTPAERRRITKALNQYKRDTKRLGDRMLQLAVSDSAARVA